MAFRATDLFLKDFFRKKKGRKKRLQALAAEDRTVIFYESPYRLVKTLNEMTEFFGENRQACVSRELSKIYEENKIGTIKELASYFRQKKVKGEIVIVIKAYEKILNNSDVE